VRWRDELRSKYFIPLCLPLAATAGSCDLLKTRDPQPPSSGNTENPPATLPQVLINNLQSCFANKNVNDYEKIFADVESVGKPFVFVPTQEASGNYAAIFSQWTTESELNYFRKAIASVSSAFIPIVSFTNDSYTSPGSSDSSLYTADYSVFLAPNTYTGHTRILLLQNKNAGTWVILRWEDYQSANSLALTWSDLKGQFSQ
jgi:hypothetical protein